MIQYAEKYASKVDERFIQKAITTPAVNNEFDWEGVNTVSVYSVPVVAMNDYTQTGLSRYGTPAELEGGVQTMTLSRDRSFTFTIDRRRFADAQMSHEAGKALSRQLDEVVIPEIEKYRIAKMADKAKTVTSAVTAANAYELFLDGVNYLTDGNTPVGGSVAFVSPKYYKMIRLDGSFMGAGDMAQAMKLTGQVGMLDGIPLILAPSAYFPENTSFLIAHPAATVAPVKLSEYKIHDNPPGINGWLIEGRFVYDAFVLDNKKGALYAHSEP